jgi:2-phosphosulfolactate phosphatase
LSETACVVFDILRATSTFVTALNNGAKEIIPVSEISEALAIRRKQPDVLLGGERDGVKIHADGIDFDFGNSPHEYTKEKIAGKTIVSTTTNGTRAFRACTKAKTILAGSFLNLSATAKFIEQQNFENLLLVCAGTRENAALEDILAAGALCELLENNPAMEIPSDAAQIALRAFAKVKSYLPTAVCNSQNARRLLAIPELGDDVPFCLQRDTHALVAVMNNDGCIQKI